MITRRNELRYVEAEGFHHGVHEIARGPAEGEMGAHFQHAAAEIRHDSVDALKTLEANEAVLTRRFQDAEIRWQRLQRETAGRPPEMGLPLIATLAAALAAVGETGLLAPVMDGFGISDPTWQLLTAATLVTVASGLLHLSVREVTVRVGAPADEHADSSSSAPAGLQRAALAVLTLFALTVIIVLGWWRGAEMIFAANVQQAEWGLFLAQHPALTKVCVTLLTLALATFAAIASDWGFSRLRYAWEWRRAKREFESILQQLEHTRKRIEALIAKRDARLAMLDEQGRQWQHAYQEKHALGRRIGASRAPLWRVVLRIAGVVAVASAACVIFDPLTAGYLDSRRLLFYGFVVAAAGGMYAARALQAWDRPTPLELYRQQAVIWRGPQESPAFEEAEGNGPSVVVHEPASEFDMPARSAVASLERKVS
jgi:ABC-type multidrug transport system fused ATPase/permease subunit